MFNTDHKDGSQKAIQNQFVDEKQQNPGNEQVPKVEAGETLLAGKVDTVPKSKDDQALQKKDCCLQNP